MIWPFSCCFIRKCYGSTTLGCLVRALRPLPMGTNLRRKFQVQEEVLCEEFWASSLWLLSQWR